MVGNPDDSNSRIDADAGAVTKKGMQQNMDSSLLVAALTTFIGGFLDAFTYVGHGDVFVNSMTGNIVLVGVFTAKGNWQQVVDHIPPLIAFLAGIFIVYRKSLPGHYRYFHQLAIGSLFVEMIFLLCFSLLPKSFPSNILVPGIALVASIQYESFARMESYNYSSVTVTVNLKRFAEAVCDYHATGSGDSKRRMKLFGLISCCFVIGALAGGFCTGYLLNAALLIPVFLIGIVLFLKRKEFW
ncbi:MAG: DUF1275 domain-containing protein [Chitinophagaceae bacterium]|nr:MAG: DUF1275 domain-containing protein [Chitinophagaceae bacterium]